MGTGNQHTDTHSLRILFFFLFQEFVIIMFFMKKIKLFLTTFLLAAMDIHSLHVDHHASSQAQAGRQAGQPCWWSFDKWTMRWLPDGPPCADGLSYGCENGDCWSQCSAFLTFFGTADWCWRKSDSGDYIKCETHDDCTREKAYEKKMQKHLFWESSLNIRGYPLNIKKYVSLF